MCQTMETHNGYYKAKQYQPWNQIKWYFPPLHSHKYQSETAANTEGVLKMFLKVYHLLTTEEFVPAANAKETP